MTTVAESIAAATAQLAAVSDTPRLDSEILLAHSLGVSRAQLLARLKEANESTEFKTLLERRKTAEPIAYIVGEWEFYGLPILCRRPVLVPRPETEHLVEVVLEFIGQAPARVLDLCTGTGCVGLAIAAHARGADVTLLDSSEDAVKLAAENRHRLELDRNVSILRGDLFTPIAQIAEPFDVICANPPYVETGAWSELSPVIRKHEDPNALLAGDDGLDVIRRIGAEAPNHLRPGGLLAFEIGEKQAGAVHGILGRHGFESIDFRDDLAGIQRIAYAITPS